MAELVATGMLLALAAHAGIGLIASAFILSRISRFDDQALGSSIIFRLLILPGMLVFWPLFLRRWRSGRLQPRTESNAHRVAARSARTTP